MTGVINFLTGDTALLLSSSGSWSVASGNVSLSSVFSPSISSSVGSLRIEVTGLGSCSVRSGNFTIPNPYTGYRYKGFAQLRVPRAITATTKVIVVTIDETYEFSSTQVVQPGVWTLVAAYEEFPVVALNETATVSLELTFSGTPGLQVGDIVYVSSPGVVAPEAIGQSLFGVETFLRLPEYLRDADETQTNPTFPMYRFLDSVHRDSELVWRIWEGIRYIPPDNDLNESPKVSRLVDPSTAPLEYLSWLAGLRGVTLRDPSSGFTPWRNLEIGLDEDNSGQAEWNEWETVPDANNDSIVSWSEIENFSTDVVDIEERLRWQTQSAAYGLNGGTLGALIDAVKQRLGGTKSVTVENFVDSDPWKIKIVTLVDETLDVVNIGDSSASIIDIITGAIPAGFEVVHEAS
jgi:hypothetical protein